MTIDTFLAQVTQRLQIAGIETARLDCLVLLEDAVGKDRSWLLAHPEFELSLEQQQVLQQSITRRELHEPLAYIRGHVEFYGREFLVNKHTLVPRPESESFIDLLKKYTLNTNSTRILDLGTGSGCIGITGVLECPTTYMTLSDVDEAALHVAHKNTELLSAKVTLVASDLLSTITERFDIIMTNLPYVPDHHPVNKPVHFEPHDALYAGLDGMDLYRKFWQQVQSLDAKPMLIMTESLPEQHNLQSKLATAVGYDYVEAQGLVQFFKIIVA